MQKIIKIRIIHLRQHNPEKEYLAEFLRFIGCLVYDEDIGFYESNWIGHLSRANDPDGFDIVLNYYGDEIGHFNNRIYFHFSLERKLCCVQSGMQCEKRIEVLPSKKAVRHKALTLLINALWHDDPANLEQIERIKEFYTPTNGDSDLFYVLQAIKCFGAFEIFSVKEEYKRITREKDAKINIGMTPYVKAMLEELWKMQCQLDGTNPYVAYARVNTARYIWKIINRLYETNRRLLTTVQYDNKTIILSAQSELISQLRAQLGKNQWFITISLLMASLYPTHCSTQKMKCYQTMLQGLDNTGFPNYLGDVYYQIGELLKWLYGFERAHEYYQIALKKDPQNYQAKLRVAYYCAMLKNYNESERFLNELRRQLLRNANLNDAIKDGEIYSFQELLAIIEMAFLRHRISLNRTQENAIKTYTTQAVVFCGILDRTVFLEKVADKNELAFTEFASFHMHAEWTYYLYKAVEPWTLIVGDKILEDNIKNIFARWGSEQ